MIFKMGSRINKLLDLYFERGEGERGGTRKASAHVDRPCHLLLLEYTYKVGTHSLTHLDPHPGSLKHLSFTFDIDIDIQPHVHTYLSIHKDITKEISSRSYSGSRPRYIRGPQQGSTSISLELHPIHPPWKGKRKRERKKKFKSNFKFPHCIDVIRMAMGPGAGYLLNLFHILIYDISNMSSYFHTHIRVFWIFFGMRLGFSKLPGASELFYTSNEKQSTYGMTRASSRNIDISLDPSGSEKLNVSLVSFPDSTT
ncbi:hypothetical protein DFH27DRAFT_293481 [Peziza echinospora]|nr:hypothetical protein DFH27DRAFT_293481 [Peziza echinospora]